MRRFLNESDRIASAARPIDVQTLAQEEEFLMTADIVASAVFPDYAVTDHTGKRRKLSDLQDQSPEDLRLAAGQHAIHMK